MRSIQAAVTLAVRTEVPTVRALMVARPLAPVTSSAWPVSPATSFDSPSLGRTDTTTARFGSAGNTRIGVTQARWRTSAMVTTLPCTFTSASDGV